MRLMVIMQDSLESDGIGGGAVVVEHVRSEKVYEVCSPCMIEYGLIGSHNDVGYRALTEDAWQFGEPPKNAVLDGTCPYHAMKKPEWLRSVADMKAALSYLKSA